MKTPSSAELPIGRYQAIDIDNVPITIIVGHRHHRDGDEVYLTECKDDGTMVRITFADIYHLKTPQNS